MRLYFATRGDEKVCSFDKENVIDWLDCDYEECVPVDGKYQCIRIKERGGSGKSFSCSDQTELQHKLMEIK